MKTVKLTAGILAAAMLLTGTATFTETTTHTAAAESALPASYDPRGSRMVTPVRDQGDYGTCWAHAMAGSLEQSLLPYDPQVDISEWYLIYSCYLSEYRNGNVSDFFTFLEDGYNYDATLDLLSRRKGLTKESNFPYGVFFGSDDSESDTDPYGESDYLITDVVQFSLFQEDEDYAEQCSRVKEYLYQGGALCYSYTSNDAYVDHTHNSYYLPAEIVDERSSPHAVTIVGWDDNFPKEYFKEQPSTDGAWLAKSSWSSVFCDNGYYWISYEQENCDVMGFSAVPAQLYDDVHSYDLGTCIGYTLPDNTARESGAMANLFTAETDTLVTAVTFRTDWDNDAYSVAVYKDLTNPLDPTSGALAATAEGSISSVGQITAELSAPVSVAAGETYAVVVTQTGDPYASHVFVEYDTMATETAPDGSVTTEYYAIPADHAPNCSFLCLDGENWVDTYSMDIKDSFTAVHDDGLEYLHETTEHFGAACITALGVSKANVQFSKLSDTLCIGDTIELTNHEGRQVYYAVNGGAYKPYTKPITFTEDMKISAYCEEGTVYEQSYTVREAEMYDIKLQLAFENGDYLLYGTDFVEVGEREYEAEIEAFNLNQLMRADLKLFSNATLTCNGQPITNGETQRISCNGETTLELVASGEGMNASTYRIHIVPFDLSLVHGDVDMDGLYTALDAAAVLTYAAAAGTGNPPALPDENWLCRADFNYNGVADAGDAATILMYAAENGAY